MTYSKDNQTRKYVKGYGFMSFAKNFGCKYGKKFLNKGSSASKRIKSTASKFNQSKYGKILKSQGSKFGKIAGKKIIEEEREIEEKEIIIPSEKRQQILDDLRLF